MFCGKLAPLCLTVAALSLGAVGCKSDMHDDDMKGDMSMDHMSKDDMMMKGDKMIKEGQMMKDDAMKMDAGMKKDDMMMKGDEMMKKGMMMKEKAAKTGMHNGM